MNVVLLMVQRGGGSIVLILHALGSSAGSGVRLWWRHFHGILDVLLNCQQGITLERRVCQNVLEPQNLLHAVFNVAPVTETNKK